MSALFALVVLSTLGPLDRPCPEGAAVARDAAQLTALLAGEEKELWIAGRVTGDFSAKRGLSLHGCEHAVLEGTGKGTVLQLQGDDVLVEDLTFQRSGIRTSFEDGALKLKGKRAMVRRVIVRDTLYGIAFEQCHDCRLEDAEISGRPELEENERGDAVKLWEAHGSQVRRIYVHGMRDVVVWYSRHVTLEDNRITGGRYGTHFMYAHDSTVRRSVLRGNTVGIFVMYSARVLAEDNELSGARGPAVESSLLHHDKLFWLR